MSNLKKSRYRLPAETKQTLSITPKVLEIFKKYRQVSFKSRESGGLLFAAIHENEIIITSVSTPQKCDWRSRFGVIINKKSRETLPKKMHTQGLHFIGEWHTHPEPTPTPSGVDLKSMADCFSQSIHEHPFFIMVIVGNSEDDLNLYVSAHNTSDHYHLLRI